MGFAVEFEVEVGFAPVEVEVGFAPVEGDFALAEV